VASCLYSSYAYFCLNNGDIYRYTLSGGAIARLGSFPFEDVKPCAIATDNTNLFWGSDKGGVHQTVIATGVTTRIARLPGKIVAMSYASAVLYCVVEGGAVYTVTTA
jgi:hypothetical protein